MKTLERIVGSALLGFIALSASAQDSKPVVVMRDDPKLTQAVAYYMPQREYKRDLVSSEEGVKVKELLYQGNSRGSTSVIALVNDHGKDLRVDIDHGYENDSESKTSVKVSAGLLDLRVWFARYKDGKILNESLVDGFSLVRDEAELSNARLQSQRWNKILDFDSWRAKTQWKSAANFFAALPFTVDVSHYDITTDSRVIGQDGFYARLHDDHKDSVNSLHFMHSSSNWGGNSLVVYWNMKRKDLDSDVSFRAWFDDNDKDGLMDEFSLGNDREERFKRDGSEIKYEGHPLAKYTPEDLRSLFVYASNKWDSLRSAFIDRIAPFEDKKK